MYLVVWMLSKSFYKTSKLEIRSRKSTIALPLVGATFMLGVATIGAFSLKGFMGLKSSTIFILIIALSTCALNGLMIYRFYKHKRGQDMYSSRFE